ncbi:unknown [Eggerthella sp. CAG:209]|nr:unknown [Eggerthella sp. CAG:209]
MNSFAQSFRCIAKVNAALRLRGEKETKGVWKSPRFWFIRLTILAKIMDVGRSGHVGKLLIVGSPFNHRIDVGARIHSKLLASG